MKASECEVHEDDDDRYKDDELFCALTDWRKGFNEGIVIQSWSYRSEVFCEKNCFEKFS